MSSVNQHQPMMFPLQIQQPQHGIPIGSPPGIPNREPTMHDVYALLLGLQNNMTSMRHDLDTGLQQLNGTVADIGQKLENLNIRVGDCEQRMSRVEDNTRDQMGDITRKLGEVTNNMTQRLAHMENAAGAAAQLVVSSIVVKNLPENQDETNEILVREITNMLNYLDPGQCTINNVYRVGNPERRPRVIVVEMATNDDCLKILKKKTKLKDKQGYKNVYIETNRSHQQRQMEANMRRICNKMPNLEFRRGRVVEK